MGLNFGEYVEENPVGEYSVDIRFTHEPRKLGNFLAELNDLTKLHGVEVSYPVMEAMVVPDLDNGGG